MHNSGTARMARLIRRNFLTADLETGFALLRAAAESGPMADRTLELRQIEEARRALQHARSLYDAMNRQDARAFAARMADLERATDAADHCGAPRVLAVARIAAMAYATSTCSR